MFLSFYAFIILILVIIILSIIITINFSILIKLYNNILSPNFWNNIYLKNEQKRKTKKK